MQELITRHDQDGVAVVTLCHRSKSNPMSEGKARALIRVFREMQEDQRVKAIVLLGQQGHSFCSGGDFAEVSTFKGGDEVDNWIDWITDLYTGLLAVQKPTIAAVRRHAIGIGFQVSLCCDWRIASQDASFWMPELAKGIGCTFGACMIERALGRNRMTQIIYGCTELSAEAALRIGLVDSVCRSEDLLGVAIAKAHEFLAYPGVALQSTKKAINRSYIEELREVGKYSKAVHRRAFASGEGQKHFQGVLARSKS